MSLSWTDEAWEQYLAWETQDRKARNRINALIKDIQRNGAMKGIGKPEPLKYRQGYSRRIDDTNRLIYDVSGKDLIIASCKGHYEE